MAATRKSAKSTARKKRSGARRATVSKAAARKSGRKSASRKSASSRARPSGKGTKKSRRTPDLKRQAEKGLRAAKEGMETVRQVGDRAWETLKSTTAQVVEGVRETLNRDHEEPRERYPDRWSSR